MNHTGNLYTQGDYVNPLLAELCSDRSRLTARGNIGKRTGAVWSTHALFVNSEKLLVGRNMHLLIKGYPVYSAYEDGYMFEGFVRMNGMGLHPVDAGTIMSLEDYERSPETVYAASGDEER